MCSSCLHLLNWKISILSKSVVDTEKYFFYHLQKEVNLPCPVNPEHSVPSKSLEEHGRSCSLLSRGYTKEELVREYIKILSTIIIY